MKANQGITDAAMVDLVCEALLWSYMAVGGCESQLIKSVAVLGVHLFERTKKKKKKSTYGQQYVRFRRDG